jgi:hypothetical protein
MSTRKKALLARSTIVVVGLLGSVVLAFGPRLWPAQADVSIIHAARNERRRPTKDLLPNTGT